MWQKCPICNGTGVDGTPAIYNMNTNNICTTCNGKKIISTITGNPPVGLDSLTEYKQEIVYIEIPLKCKICGKHIKLPGNGIMCELCECNLK